MDVVHYGGEWLLPRWTIRCNVCVTTINYTITGGSKYCTRSMASACYFDIPGCILSRRGVVGDINAFVLVELYQVDEVIVYLINP